MTDIRKSYDYVQKGDNTPRKNQNIYSSAVEILKGGNPTSASRPSNLLLEKWPEKEVRGVSVKKLEVDKMNLVPSVNDLVGEGRKRGNIGRS